MERTRRHQAQDEFLAVDDEGMGRVVAALKAHDYVGVGGEQVNNFTFTFIAPLRTDHGNSLHSRCPGRSRCAADRIRPRVKGASMLQSRRFKV